MFTACNKLTLLSHRLAWNTAIALTHMTTMCQMTHLHSKAVELGFKKPRFFKLETSKALSKAPPPILSTSGFQLQPLGTKQLRAPKLLLN